MTTEHSKVVGGSSSSGQKHDDRAQAGDAGWAWDDDVLPLFRERESHRSLDEAGVPRSIENDVERAGHLAFPGQTI